MTRRRTVESRIHAGNPGKRAIPVPKAIAGRVMPGEPIPPPPRGTSRGFRQAWREITSYMVAGGIYDKSDRFVVEGAATQLALVRRLSVLIDEIPDAAGLLAETTRGHTVDPRVGHLREALTGLRMYLDALDMTPVGRTRRAEFPRGSGEAPERGSLAKMRKAVGAPDLPSLRALPGRGGDPDEL